MFNILDVLGQNRWSPKITMAELSWKAVTLL